MNVVLYSLARIAFEFQIVVATAFSDAQQSQVKNVVLLLCVWFFVVYAHINMSAYVTTHIYTHICEELDAKNR